LERVVVVEEEEEVVVVVQVEAGRGAGCRYQFQWSSKLRKFENRVRNQVYTGNW
jgi:hypothetical protein